MSQNISLHDRSIIINLLEGIKIQGRMPNFVHIITERSSLSRGTIQKRIQVGKFITNLTEGNKNILLYRSNKISRTKFFTEINRKEQNTDL